MSKIAVIIKDIHYLRAFVIHIKH